MSNVQTLSCNNIHVMEDNGGCFQEDRTDSISIQIRAGGTQQPDVSQFVFYFFSSDNDLFFCLNGEEPAKI